jgi:hypothetical protein
MPGAGASSITFWCRRWSEQSRSNRCTARVPSPKTCTSIWRGFSTNFSIRTASLPKAVAASPLRARQRVHELAGAATLRIPLPPPPATALIRTG